jgi:tetratricopeptide (TPR) repeat protein
MTSSFKRLRDFIQKQMRMSHIYQPVMIRELLKGSVKASIRKIAGAFLINAMSCSHDCTHGGCHRSEIGVPAMKIVKLIAALLIGFFLSFQHSALAQSAKEASQLNNRAVELYKSGRYSEAEPLYKRSLAIQEKVLGPNHPNVATSLNNLAELYHTQGRYADAEPLYKRSLAIREKVLGPNHPTVATSLNDLAELYRAQGRYADAEPLYKRSLEITEKVLGPNHPDVATSLNNLAKLYYDEGRYADALPIVQRTIAQKNVVKSVAFGVIHGAQSTR